MRCRYFFILIAFALIPSINLSQIAIQPQQLRKSALVIGNGNYSSSVLANPENDVRAIDTVLKRLGFIVFKYENLNQSQMKRAIDDFGLKLKGFDVGLFYFAGHGIQSNGYNYLIPVDAQLTTEQQVEYDCVQADRILALMEGSGTKVNIIILDACRNNPFERAWTRSSTGKGLAFMNAPSGTLIAYSTSPGSTAQDGSGKNSPYTSAILESIQIQNISITQMFQNVTRIVSQKSEKQQIPWISSSLTGDFYFNTTDAIVSDTQNKIQIYIPEETNNNTEDNFFIDPNSKQRYKTVKIGNQVWMAENLKSTKYNDGTAIPLVTDNKTWDNLTTPAYCWYNNDQVAYNDTYGVLYNWYTINTAKLCFKGWHVPTDADWTILSTFLGGLGMTGGKLKETGTDHWASPNNGATNETGFTALPSGVRFYGDFQGIREGASWWSASETDFGNAWFRSVANFMDDLGRINLPKSMGLSIRCIRD